jgi:ferritin-like metal-binding protein YciE
MVQRKTADDLFVHMLSDIHSAEKQLTKAPAKLPRAASYPQRGHGRPDEEGHELIDEIEKAQCWVLAL